MKSGVGWLFRFGFQEGAKPWDANGGEKQLVNFGFWDHLPDTGSNGLKTRLVSDRRETLAVSPDDALNSMKVVGVAVSAAAAVNITFGITCGRAME